MRLSTLRGGIGLACCLASAIVLIGTKGPGRLVADEATQDVHVSAENGGMARAEFVLRNPGGQPIHILNVKSGCGCARPTVTNSLVLPGGTTTVQVAATPPAIGERVVLFQVQTDSKTTPTVPLRLSVTAEARAPRLLTVVGDVVLRGSDGDIAPVPFTVLTIEQDDDDSTSPPSVTSDIPSIQITHDRTAVRPRPSEGLFTKYYHYTAQTTGETEQNTAAGAIVIHDPWNQDRSLTTPVRVEHNDPVQVFPRQVNLISRNGITAPLGEFFVRAVEPFDELEFEEEDPGAHRLEFQQRPSTPGSLLVRVEVRVLDSAPMAEGRRFRVRARPGGLSAPATVHIAEKGGGQ